MSTAPKHYSQPDPNTKMTKNKKKKLKKKQKAKQLLLENQMKELEEMEEKEARQALESCDITTTNASGEEQEPGEGRQGEERKRREGRQGEERKVMNKLTHTAVHLLFCLSPPAAPSPSSHYLFLLNP